MQIRVPVLFRLERFVVFVFTVSLIQSEAIWNSVLTRSVSEGDWSERVKQPVQLRRTSDSGRVGPAKYGQPALALADAAGW